MLRTIFGTAALALAVTPALADDHDDMASPEEAAAITELLAKINCKPDSDAGIEKERDDLFEMDDAECAIGQYDIKVNGAMQITSMTLD